MELKPLVDQVWATFEAGDLNAMTALMAPDIEFRGLGDVIVGRDAMRAYLASWREAFPDLHHETLDHVEAGDTIALELNVRGTHTGTLRAPQGDIPATGRSVLFESLDYLKVRDGLIVSWHVYNDRMAFLEQMGLLPEPAAQGT